MFRFVCDLLECTRCHGTLAWDIAASRGERIEEGEACCTVCAARYPVREGIGLFLTPDLPREDPWEQMESGLVLHLREHPDLERRLMAVPVDSLAPADQLFRALALEERGDYAQAQTIAKLAQSHLYTPEYLACLACQRRYLVERVAGQLAGSDDPVVDLATGRGDLLELLARELNSPIVATDLSPRILRRDRGWLEYLGLYERVSLLAMDARSTPFRSGAISMLTTNLGLPNIEDPEQALVELRRTVSGTFLAISYFIAEDDASNALAVHAAGRSAALFRREVLGRMASAGWQVRLANSCEARAKPTPRGVVLEGAVIDGLPIAEAVLEWGVLVAH